MTADGELAGQPAAPAGLASPVRLARAHADRSGSDAAHADHAAAGPLSTDEVLGQVETAVIVVDHYRRLRYANSFAAALYGFGQPADLVGIDFRSLGFDEEDMGKVKDLERQACRGRDWEGTLSIKRPDGSKFFIRMTAVALRSADGEVTGTVIMARQAVQLGATAGYAKFGLLDRIGETLGTTLEFDVTLRSVAQLLVPQFADHCFIDLYKSDGLVQHLVRRVQMNAWNWTPGQGAWHEVGEKVNYPPGHFCRVAIEENEVVLIEDIDFSAYPAPTPDSMAASVNAGLRSVIAAPLITRGQRLGVMSLALSSLSADRDVRNYGPEDRDLFAAIASRVAIAIDNAMLFEEERNTAVAFQDSLLPPRNPPMLDGLEVAYRYVPAKPLEDHGQGIQTQVGGDWYDIIPLSAGRVGIVIGDVEGRGARAAAIMGQLRSALRAFAQDDKAPADILHRLDDWCRAMKDDRDESGIDWPIVSCTYLIYDPWYRKLTIANAGHMSPLIVSEQHVRPMEIEQGVLLGVRGIVPGIAPYREESRDLPAGSTLMFYTDGLVDRRQREDGSGNYEDAEVFAMLTTAVSAVARQGVEQIVAAAEHAVPGEIDDDMAILAIRTSPEELHKWERSFLAEPIKVSEARKLAFDTFIEYGMDDDQADLACLLVSEVVTNVVLHTSAGPAPRHEFALGATRRAGTPSALDEWIDSPYSEDFAGAHGDFAGPPKEFTLRIRKGRTSVWVEVLDSDLRLPRIRMAGENDEGGRGLYLVDQLAERWGSRPTEEGKAVWFELPIKPAAVGLLSATDGPEN
ncbi:MAG TPA: SpoIIE family protein phosphatase [Streptosporangiaceae bacterium]|nr:SpoIIE family protein phosphatase [Streptosporangiaceae bacterium]